MKRFLTSSYVFAFLFLVLFRARAADEINTHENLLRFFSSQGFQFKMMATSQKRDSLPLIRAGDIVSPQPGRYELHYNRPILDVLREVQAREGQVVLDSTLFVQISALVLNGQGREANAILYPQGDIEPLKGKGAGYIRPSDDQIMSDLQKSSLLNKGQWVLLLGPDRYLGLSVEGPVVRSIDDWIQTLKTGLFRELDQRKSRLIADLRARLAGGCSPEVGLDPRTNFEAAQIEYFYLVRVSGGLDHWKLTSFSLGN